MARGEKYRYRVTNRSEYDRALVNRGNLTIWFDEETMRAGWTPVRSQGRGKTGRYSELAIQTCLTLEVLFGLAYRASEAFVSLLVSLRSCFRNSPIKPLTLTRQGLRFRPLYVGKYIFKKR